MKITKREIKEAAEVLRTKIGDTKDPDERSVWSEYLHTLTTTANQNHIAQIVEKTWGEAFALYR